VFGILSSVTVLVLSLVIVGQVATPMLAGVAAVACVPTYHGQQPVVTDAMIWTVGRVAEAMSAAQPDERQTSMCVGWPNDPPGPRERERATSQLHAPEVFTLPAGSQLVSRGQELCVHAPRAPLRLAAEMTERPAQLLFICALLAANRVFRRAAATGGISLQTASDLRRLGWLLIVGELLAALIATGARAYFVASQLPCVPWLPPAQAWELSLPVVIAGAVVLTFARVLRIGASAAPL
jgi:hypothetical protein